MTTILPYDDPLAQFARRRRYAEAGDNAWQLALQEAGIPRVNLGASFRNLDKSQDPKAYADCQKFAEGLDAAGGQREVDAAAALVAVGPGVPSPLDDRDLPALIGEQAGEQRAGEAAADDGDASRSVHDSGPNASAIIVANRWQSS